MPIPKEANPTDVVSSNLKKVGYVKATRTLYVEFTDGGVYKYDKVPEEQYNALVSAASVGKYFTASIRSKYQFEKV